MFENSKSIWLKDNDEINCYADFREKVFFEEGEKYTLNISVNSNYALYINDIYVDGGQYADYEEWRAYDTLDVSEFLKIGENELIITAYWQGKDTSCYRLAPASVVYALYKNGYEIAVSDENTDCRKNRKYISSPCPIVSDQLGFAINYDSRIENGEFEKPAVSKISPDVFHARPIKKLVLHEPQPGRIMTQGVFRVLQKEPEHFGREMMHSFNSFREGPEMRSPHEFIQFLPSEIVFTSPDKNSDGIYFVVDYMQENTGFCTLDVEVEDDTQILCGYGEHTEDMRVRTAVGPTNYVFRYFAKKGRNRFIFPYRRMGLRYMEFHVYAHKIKVYYAGFRPTLYPLDNDVSYDTGDLLHNKIYDVCKRTLLMCMHEHYEDCPMREQSQYTMDSRNQMLTGYYVFREYAFAKASLRLMALGIRDDDMLELCTPARVSITIPCFSAIYLTAAAEYLEHSGDTDFVREILPVLERISNRFVNATEKNGLIRRFKEFQYWNFYEWQPGLDGRIGYETPENEWTYDAPLCAFVSFGFRSMAKIYAVLGNEKMQKHYTQLSLNMNENINRVFWDDKKNAYASFMLDGKLSHYCELTQSLIAYADAAPKPRLDIIIGKLKSGELMAVTPSHAIFKYEALLQNLENKQFVFEDIARVWGYMLYNSATTFWETSRGACDMGNAASLCHGWSATPAYLYLKYFK